MSGAGGEDTDRYLELSETSHAVNSGFSGRSGLKKQDGEPWMKTFDVDYWPPYI